MEIYLCGRSRSAGLQKEDLAALGTRARVGAGHFGQPHVCRHHPRHPLASSGYGIVWPMD
jgi:hypothetical protein